MKAFSLRLAVSAIAVCGFQFATSAQAQVAGDRVPDHYIVTVQDGANGGAVAARHGIQARFVYSAAVNGFAGAIPPGLLRRLANDPQVVSITPDRVVTAIGKGKPGGGGGGTTGEVIPEGVKRIGADTVAVYSGAGVGVAIVDTGIDLGHLDLSVGGDGGESFSAFGGAAQDDNGHGTHVAGIVAAKKDEQGVVGVAPGATLYAVKVLDAGGSGSDATVVAGLNWVASYAGTVNPPIRVVNMSLGRPGSVDDNPALRAAVQSLTAAGVTVVVAAGNERSMEVSQQVPATYPEVIAVASTTARTGKANRKGLFVPADTASYFTTDGAWDESTGIGVTVSAPGEDQEDVTNGNFVSSVGILSTALGGGTTRMSGTSMASPHVAGVVALVQQKAGLAVLGTEAVRLAIINGATRVGEAPLPSLVTGYTDDKDAEGVLSALGALGQ